VSKQSLLLVDGDTRSLRVLEVSLRKAGFMVTAALSVQDALDKLELHAPDLIISETTFPDGDGFELRRRVRATSEWSEIPFIFLTAEAAIENKIRGLELGVDDYLTKPIYIKEIVTRINILLQKRQRVRFEERRDGRTRFAGRVQDMPVVDVIQTIEISRKSGVIQFVGERGRQAAIYFRDGRVIDAEAGALQGEDAVYRLLTWGEGEFEVMFRTVRRREVITMSSQGLLMEGMRRLDEWSRLFEQLPPLTHRFEVDTVELAARLGDVPDDNNRILRLFDGKRTLMEVIDSSDVGDLECMQAISRLYFEELLLDLDHESAPRRDTGKALPLVEFDAPTPFAEAAAGRVAAVTAERADEDVAPDAVEDSVPQPAVDDGPSESDAGWAGAPDDGGPASSADVGPLMGGYRPSSLRLIDEAVAAAQAIEPSLFEDNAGHAGSEVESRGGNGVARRAVIFEAPVVIGDQVPTSVEVSETRAAGREESGLRMIGSLGRDRAEASGELAPLGTSRPRRSETARELVTILPRRSTREMAAVPPAAAPSMPPEPAPDLAESLPTPTPASPVLESRPAPAPALEIPGQLQSPGSHPRVALPGSGVRAPSRSRRILRIVRSIESNGPGLGPLLLILLAAVLAGTAVLLRLRRHARVSENVEAIHDARPAAAAVPFETWAGTPDAMVVPAPEPAVPAAGSSDSVTLDAGAPALDAGPRATDTRPRPREPGGAAPAPVAPSVADKIAQAKVLYDKAHDALDEGDFTRALELTDASLKLRRTARTFLLRAQAQQRLDRVEDALASIDAATQLAPGFGTVWELRGRILWAARRRDEARTAFEKFLELDPNSPKAAAVRRLMNEPR
jgi:DNA-binding response OmpR family regulator